MFDLIAENVNVRLSAPVSETPYDRVLHGGLVGALNPAVDTFTLQYRAARRPDCPAMSLLVQFAVSPTPYISGTNQTLSETPVSATTSNTEVTRETLTHYTFEDIL